MSILDVTESKIFRTLGKGKAVKITSSPEVDEFMKKLIEEMDKLNNGINGIQKMIKWYIAALFLVVLALLLGLILK